jgi:hypothetical protein
MEHKKNKDNRFIKGAMREMEKKGTKGAFTNQAKRAGMTTTKFAKRVLSNPDKFTETTRKRAQFFKNINPEKFDFGGEIRRGYDVNVKSGVGTYARGGTIMDKKLEFAKELEGQNPDIEFTSLDWDDINSYDELYRALEDDGYFLQEITYYSKAMAYLSEEDPSLSESIQLAVDYGYQTKDINSEFLASLLKSEKVRGYFQNQISEIEQFFENLEKEFPDEFSQGGDIADLKVTSVKYQNTRRGVSYIAKTNIKGVEIVNDGMGGETFLTGPSKDIKPYKNLSEFKLEELIDKYEMQKLATGGDLFDADTEVQYKKGGDTKKKKKKFDQGFDDKLDESASMRRGKESTKEQTFKDRRDESKAMEKALGRRAYSSVRTMDKNRRTLKPKK